jgi:HD superfamily phosphohydrolase
MTAIVELRPIKDRSFSSALQDTAPLRWLAEQALRLAALFHDLGHLPYSHDFENSIEEFWLDLSQEDKERSPFRKLVEQGRGQMKIHERIGHELAWILLRALFSDLRSEPNGEAIRLSFEFARSILEESVLTPNAESTDAVFQWLHTWMASWM